MKPASPPPAKPPSPNPDAIPELEDPLPKWKPAGKLIEEDGGLRFMDSYLLGTVYDEVNHSQDAHFVASSGEPTC